jgi:hypothetical protein
MTNTMVWARVRSEIKKGVEKLAEERGVSLSEYVRELVLRDLDGKSYFKRKLDVKEKQKREKTSK